MAVNVKPVELFLACNRLNFKISYNVFFFQTYQVKQTFKKPSGGISTKTIYIKGNKTTYTFKYLKFNTSYTFDVRTKLVNGDLGRDVTIIKRTGPFSASVGPLRKKIQDNTVILSWSAPWTIDLKKDLKVNLCACNLINLILNNNLFSSKIGSCNVVSQDWLKKLPPCQLKPHKYKAVKNTTFQKEQQLKTEKMMQRI